MIGYPLDSHVTFNDGVPEYDRAISSAPLRELYRSIFSDGVPSDVAANMQVQYVGTARIPGVVEGDSSTYNVVVNPGFAMCAGCMKLQEDYYGLTMDASNTSNPRIDTLVLRLNDNESVRSCDFHIVQGVPSANPVAPALTRNSSVWEIGLANLYKPAVVSSVNPVTVVDTRYDPARCGVLTTFAVPTGQDALTSNTIVYVSTSGSDVNGDGSYSNPYATIQKAINSIPKNLNGFECVVNVTAGTYAETVNIRDYAGGTIVLNGTRGSVVNISGLDIRNCSVLVDSIHLAVGNGGIYVGGLALLYCATGTMTVTGAAEAVTLRYGAVLEVTTTLTINNASSRALQVQYASTASVTTLAGAGNAIGVYAYHSTVFVRNQTISATTQTINENSTINVGGAVG